MILYLVRHGNTFNPGDPVLRAGSKTDYPLVEKGREQARAFAKFLQSKKVKPKELYCSPLIRTKEFNEIICSELNINNEKVLADPRLNEVDYGQWSGFTDQEIEEKFGNTQLEQWNKYSVWQEDIFGESEKKHIEDTKSFLDQMKQPLYRNTTIVATSSNGKIRYFLKHIGEEFEKRLQSELLKVKTGHYCRLEFLENAWLVTDWNIDPKTQLS